MVVSPHPTHPQSRMEFSQQLLWISGRVPGGKIQIVGPLLLLDSLGFFFLTLTYLEVANYCSVSSRTLFFFFHIFGILRILAFLLKLVHVVSTQWLCRGYCIQKMSRSRKSSFFFNASLFKQENYSIVPGVLIYFIGQNWGKYLVLTNLREKKWKDCDGFRQNITHCQWMSQEPLILLSLWKRKHMWKIVNFQYGTDGMLEMMENNNTFY